MDILHTIIEENKVSNLKTVVGTYKIYKVKITYSVCSKSK